MNAGLYHGTQPLRRDRVLIAPERGRRAAATSHSPCFTVRPPGATSRYISSVTVHWRLRHGAWFALRPSWVASRYIFSVTVHWRHRHGARFALWPSRATSRRLVLLHSSLKLRHNACFTSRLSPPAIRMGKSAGRSFHNKLRHWATIFPYGDARPGFPTPPVISLQEINILDSYQFSRQANSYTVIHLFMVVHIITKQTAWSVCVFYCTVKKRKTTFVSMYTYIQISVRSICKSE